MTKGQSVVIIGIPGLRWTDISLAATPALWRLARRGSVGSLVVSAVRTYACPADAWLTLNAAARAMAPRPASGSCPPLPRVMRSARQPGPGSGRESGPGSGRESGPEVGRRPGPAWVPALAGAGGIEARNRPFSYAPDWGLLAAAAGPGGCATAVGPGAALALAGPRGGVSRYLPHAGPALLRQERACPLTVAALRALPGAGGPARRAAVRAASQAAGQIAAAAPPGAVIVVAGLGDGTAPHLRAIIVAGPGFRRGLLASAATRQPGLVLITDLTSSVLGWRTRRAVAPQIVGAQVRAVPRGPLPAAIRMLTRQDTAAQVCRATIAPFFAVYGTGAAAALAAVAAALRGPARRARRRAGYRVVAAASGAVPAGTFLGGLAPWPAAAHPALLLYGAGLAAAAVIAVAALAGPWRRDPLGPPGFIGAVTVAVIGADVLTGSRLQLGTPFGLSVLTAGRFYGIGNNAIGVYAVGGLLAATWAAVCAGRHPDRPLRRSGRERRGRPPAGAVPPAEAALGGEAAPCSETVLHGEAAPRRDAAPGGEAALRSGPGRRDGAGHSRRRAVAAAGAVAVPVVAVAAWPGFGAKVSGTIALVPAFGVLLAGLAGVRVTPCRAALLAAGGVAVSAVLAVLNYLISATGPSDIGAFAGHVLHGGATAILRRKITASAGSLTESPAAPAIPPALAGAGLLLARARPGRPPRILGAALAGQPALRPLLAAVWLAGAAGWLASDSGVTVPAAALPLVLPAVLAIVTSTAAGPAGPAGAIRPDLIRAARTGRAASPAG